MVKMTAFKHAGDYRDALSCRMMFPLDSVFYQPGHFRPVDFSAVVLNYFYRIQQMI